MEIMEKAFDIAGYDKETLKDKFGALYNAFQFGAPSHAGMAPGVDRMIMLLRKEENSREIIAFPMSGTAQDLMCGASNEITEQQLREVHIKVRQKLEIIQIIYALKDRLFTPKIGFYIQ